MLIRRSTTRSLALSLASTLFLLGCEPQDDPLGKEGQRDSGADTKLADGPAPTCQQDGGTYQVGESVTVSACTTCVCQQDGKLGQCTGLCLPDAASPSDVAVTCSQDGKRYQVNDIITISACTTCICQADGSVGLCTGLCLPDAAEPSDAAVTCTQNGKTYQVGEAVTLSACTTCVCQKDGKLGLCTGACPPDAAVPNDATVTCTANGKTYQVGELRSNGCSSCACLADGTWGQCTGDCPPVDARPSYDADSPAALCTQSQGQVTSTLCCMAVGDFPNSCLTGACGCSSSNSHSVSTCTCPPGTCFDPAKGCVGMPEVCTPGQDQTCNADLLISSIVGHCNDDGSCLCPTGTVREANGKCRTSPR